MIVPLALMMRFFQLVSVRKFSEAERVFERISAKMARKEEKEFNLGYLDAIKGIILAHRSTGGSYDFFSNLDFENLEGLKKNLNDFNRSKEMRFHADYDRGYFSALTDYMRVVIETTKDKSKKINKKTK